MHYYAAIAITLDLSDTLVPLRGSVHSSLCGSVIGVRARITPGGEESRLPRMRFGNVPRDVLKTGICIFSSQLWFTFLPAQSRTPWCHGQ